MIHGHDEQLLHIPRSTTFVQPQYLMTTQIYNLESL